MPRPGTLTTPERSSIRIDNFIFHLIITGRPEPECLERVELEPAQVDFFCECISKSAEGTQYRFRDKEAGVSARCKQIIGDPAGIFVDASKKLAGEFLDHHAGNMNDGAFIIAHFSITNGDPEIPMIALLKMDHQKVLEYTIKDVGGERIATMNQVLNSFVEDKAAVQKSAIIDVADHFEWDVLASERKRPRGIADYFRAFLHVVDHENDSNLTRNAVNSVGEWSKRNRGTLPDKAWLYKQRAVDYMETHDSFDTDEFLNMVIRDDNLERKQGLVQSLRATLEERGVAGQRFSPSPGSIPGKDKQTKLVTDEGVTITWKGSDQTANVDVMPPDETGMQTIIIRTQRITNA